MSTTVNLRNPLAIGSFLLSNFAAIWGFVIAPIYMVGFGLLLPQVVAHAGTPGQAMILPLELPLIGLLLGAGGALLSRASGSQHRLVAALGLLFNAIPAGLAVALWALRQYG